MQAIYVLLRKGISMRKVRITVQGPLGYKDAVNEYGEDALLLTASGEVKPARKLKENDVLISFQDSFRSCSSILWKILKIEWPGKPHNNVKGSSK
jgi:hypothetical protein